MALEVLVTGGNGKLGRQIVHHLRSRNYRVTACGRSAGQNVDAVLDLAGMDTPDPDTQPDIVVHAAAAIGGYQNSLATAMPLMSVNTLGTLRVAQWCISRCVKRLILVSGAIVYGEWQDTPKSESDPVKPYIAGPYAVSKACSEYIAELVKSAGCELTILRLTSLYGPGYQKGIVYKFLVEGHNTGKIVLRPPWDDAFDLLHVYDGGNAVALAVESQQSDTWNIGSGQLTTIKDLATECAHQIDARVIFVNDEAVRNKRILNWVNDEKARSELGHSNHVSLVDGVSEIVRMIQ